jgi:hypothetical protein
VVKNGKPSKMASTAYGRAMLSIMWINRESWLDVQKGFDKLVLLEQIIHRALWIEKTFFVSKNSYFCPKIGIK